MDKCSNLHSIDCLHKCPAMKSKSKEHHLQWHTSPKAPEVEEMAEMAEMAGMEAQANHLKDRKWSMCRWCLVDTLGVPLHHRMHKHKHEGIVHA